MSMHYATDFKVARLCDEHATKPQKLAGRHGFKVYLLILISTIGYSEAEDLIF